MSECLIEIERDSVSMGDDVDAPHFYSFKARTTVTLREVFELLESERYLAAVGGKNHSWEAIIGGDSVALFRANSRRPEPCSALSNAISRYATAGVVRIRFKYNSAAD